jgi:hypothetical protein
MFFLLRQELRFVVIKDELISIVAKSKIQDCKNYYQVLVCKLNVLKLKTKPETKKNKSF